MEQLDDRETASTSAGHASRPWLSLAQDYERARAREDSLDRILEWPAQRALIGDVKGLSVLDVGCGNGSKLAELVDAGANDCVGIDISGNFPSDTPPGMSLIKQTFPNSMRCPNWQTAHSTESRFSSRSDMQRIRSAR